MTIESVQERDIEKIKSKPEVLNCISGFIL